MPLTPTLRRRARRLLACVALLFLVGNGWAQEMGRNAEMNLYVFKKGVPVADIEVLLDETLVGVTDARGVIRFELPPGIRFLELRDQDTVVLAQQLLVNADELSQWIVNITEGMGALVDAESSGGGDAALTGTAATALEGEGEPGSLDGVLISADDGKPIAGARIFVSGQSQDIRTGDDGRFAVEVPAGQYSISILHSTHNTLTREGVEVVADASTDLRLELTPAGSELPEFVVIEPYIEGSLASVLAERRESEGVTDVLSAEQIARAGDSDAAGALKRVTGLTLVGGQYIYVRGLGERYSSVLLNNASIPSPDPTRKVVPLSLFPTDVIAAVVVQKTGSAPLPGEFGGGTVQLRTVSFPEGGLTANFSASIEYLDGTTFDTGLGYDGGGTDWLGVDDGTRAVPDVLADAIAGGVFLRPRSFTNPDGFTREEIEEFGEAVGASSSYDATARDIPPGLGLSGALGNSFDFFGDGRWGFLTAFKYDNKWANLEEDRRTYSAVNDGLQLADDVDLERTVNRIDTGLFANLGFSLPAGHDVGFNAMLLRQTEDETRITEGLQDSQQIRRFLFEWIENELLSYQVVGSHALPLEDWTLDWQYTDATASREEPNTRNYRRDDDDGDGEYIISTRSDSNAQTWAELEDNLSNWTVDTTLPFRFGRHGLALRAGLNDVERDRLASIRTFSFQGRIPNELRELSYEELYTPRYIGDVVNLSEGTRATDTYTATQNLEAAFLNLDLTLFDERLRLTAGVRSEDNLQRVVTADLSNPNAPPVIGEIDQTDRLPSGAITWAYSDNAQLRAAYAESVNRPDFREQAPAPYLDPLLDIVTVGNPDLVTAELKNYDLRWEYYFSPSESVSIAAFYKEFTNPIEKTFSSGGSAKIITLQNALGAELSGIEFDYSQSLGWIEKVDWLNWLDEFQWGFLGPYDWENFTLAFNYAVIESSVDIDLTTTTQTNTDRQLQGQSPWVVNFQLGYYNPDSPHEWTLLYNEFGERITQAGVLGQPDIFEQPFPQFDFVYKRRLAERWRLSLKLKNLLDATVRFTQGEETTREFKPGREFSLSMSWTL